MCRFRKLVVYKQFLGFILATYDVASQIPQQYHGFVLFQTTHKATKWQNDENVEFGRRFRSGPVHGLTTLIPVLAFSVAPRRPVWPHNLARLCL